MLFYSKCSFSLNQNPTQSKMEDKSLLFFTLFSLLKNFGMNMTHSRQRPRHSRGGIYNNQKTDHNHVTYFGSIALDPLLLQGFFVCVRVWGLKSYQLHVGPSFRVSVLRRRGMVGCGSGQHQSFRLSSPTPCADSSVRTLSR